MTLSEITTPRLRLVAITTEMMDADAAGSPQLSELLSADVPASWPPEHWEPHVFAFMKGHIARRPATLGWNRYVVVEGQTRTLIGTVGGFPRTEGEAEIGYSILQPWRRLGFASEAVNAFTRELFRTPAVRSISAQTLPDLTGSLGVLRRCGFVFAGPGEEPGAVRYRLERVG